MTIFNSSVQAEIGILSACEVSDNPFLQRISFFEQKYRDKFQGGWVEFYFAHTLGKTDESNLDYDEWAFLCEHFMKELTESWRPPGGDVNSQEKPELNSGFSFAGDTITCLTLTNTLIVWNGNLVIGTNTAVRMV